MPDKSIEDRFRLIADPQRREEVARHAGNLLRQGYHCSEAMVLGVGGALLDAVNEQALRMSTPFGGGVGGTYHDVCGAFSGGLMVIGALYGRTETGTDDSQAYRLASRFRERFGQELGSTNCGELRSSGYGGEGTPCAVLVERAARILLEVLVLED